jgi:hypothetical protein
MLIDCDTCIARDLACRDCVVTVLLQLTPHTDNRVDLDDAERAAIDSLAGAGLVPPLRLVADPMSDSSPSGREIA